MFFKRLLLFIGIALALSSCGEDTAPPNNSNPADLSSITLSEKPLGDFPFIAPPPGNTFGYEVGIDPKSIIEVDTEYFAVNGKLVGVKGKSFKSPIEANYINGARHLDAAKTEAGLDQAITALGGVKVNAVPVPKSEWNRIGDAELLQKHYGSSLDINGLDRVKTYVIRQKDRTVWIQFNLWDQYSGQIAIVESK